MHTQQDMNINNFVKQLRQLQDGYVAARRSGATPDNAGEIWSVLHPWNDVQASRWLYLLVCVCMLYVGV